MVTTEIRGPIPLDMPGDSQPPLTPDSVSGWAEDRPISAVNELGLPLSGTIQSTSAASMIADERMSLKRQAAIRRDGNLTDPKARRAIASSGSSSPLRSLTRQPELNGHGRIRNGSISRMNGADLTLSVGNDAGSSHIERRLSALSFEDPITPRPRQNAEDSIASASSCDSEEDKQLLTPVDMPAPLGLTPTAIAPCSPKVDLGQDSPGSSNGSANAALERNGIHCGVASLGASTDVAQLGLGLDGRRGAPEATPSPKPEVAGQAASRFVDGILGSTSASRGNSAVPGLSRSTLYQMGMVEGITPPASSVSATGTAPIAVSSVVSTGLEMGLGVNLAASALLNNIPGASSAVSGLAEPRYLRSSAAGTSASISALDHATHSTPLHLTDSQLQSASQSDRAPEDVTLSALENADNELHRRRTTGWMGGKVRQESAKVAARHQRAGTFDPVHSHYARLNLHQQQQQQQYQQDNYMSLRSSPVINTQGLPSSYMLDMPLSAETSLERNSSFGGQSSSRAQASAGGSTHPGTPSIDEKALLSPDTSHHLESSNPFDLRSDKIDASASGMDRSRGRNNGGAYGNDGAPQGPANGALMGLGAGGHFAPGVKAKVAEILPGLINSIPLSGEEGETVSIAEYGCLNTRSMQLLQPIISLFAQKAHVHQAHGCEGEDFFPSLRTMLGSGGGSDLPCRVNFSVVHEDSPQADFRPVSQTLDTSTESYLNPHWQATHEPSLQNAVFPSFVSRPFASRIVPPSTMHLGISLMDLHWSHTPRNPAVSLSTSAHAELIAFLTARAHEFKKGGVFVMAYIARSDADTSAVSLPDRPKSSINCDTADMAMEESAVADLADGPLSPSSARPMARKERTRSNSTPLRPRVTSGVAAGMSNKDDIWTTLTNTLAPCLQRLVSCGMLKSDVARHLLSLPMHPRTPRQTHSVLKSVRHLWKTEWSCGLGESDTDRTPDSMSGGLLPPCEPQPLRLPHPAWKALQAGTLSRVAFAEHMIQLFKNLYEAHFRVILREKGRLSKGAVEFVLDSLWDVLQSRIDDQEPCPIAECELEVQVVALRRI